MAEKTLDDMDMDTDAELDGKGIIDVAEAIVARGRAVAERVPAVAGGARGALAEAQGQVNQLSDAGLIGAVGFTVGLTSGLFVAGAPRILLALSAVPVAITVRAAIARGVGPDRLMN